MRTQFEFQAQVDDLFINPLRISFEACFCIGGYRCNHVDMSSSSLEPHHLFLNHSPENPVDMHRSKEGKCDENHT